MPYEGDSPVDCWEYWFDEPPDPTVRLCLAQREKEFSAQAVIEAIQITGGRFPLLEGDDYRLQYMTAVLRRKELERVAPERAKEERQIDVVLKYWNNKRISEWSLSRSQVRRWVQYIDAEGIKALIYVATGWRDFKDLIEQAIAKTPKYERELAEEKARAEAEAAAEAAREALTVLPGRRRRRR